MNAIALDARPDATTPTSRDETRLRLLRAAVEVFARHGYHGASTREICECAGANSAAIHYHFRDKAGLYRELFRLPMEQVLEVSRPMNDRSLPMHERMQHFYRGLLSVLSCDEWLAKLMLLHAREEVEPSGVLEGCHTQAIRPHHDQLVNLLREEFQLDVLDDDLHALAFAMVGVALIYFMGRPEVEAFAPALLATAEAREALVTRSALFGQALMDAEKARRSAA